MVRGGTAFDVSSPPAQTAWADRPLYLPESGNLLLRAPKPFGPPSTVGVKQPAGVRGLIPRALLGWGGLMCNRRSCLMVAAAISITKADDNPLTAVGWPFAHSALLSRRRHRGSRATRGASATRDKLLPA